MSIFWDKSYGLLGNLSKKIKAIVLISGEVMVSTIENFLFKTYKCFKEFYHHDDM